ncbi:MAG TPA: nicotinate (nicotinamide) nucleotide adenylyltransferase [Kofleriaceae bacterium]|nr:nicotinate (nicotinamide) nucleotide adenylyltransferase [Kofleriaceae bacterium]
MADRRVALFGGSFNPPHLAHQMACLVVLETEAVDQLWMIPTFHHPFGKSLAAFDDRLEMCRRAASALGERVLVSDIERELGGAESRTYDTLVELRRRHPGVRFRLVIGEDILAERDAWHRWDDVVALAPPIVLGRTGAGRAAGAAGDAPRIELPDVSSTEVRELLARGDSAVPLVPRAVMDYIAGRGLYR